MAEHRTTAYHHDEWVDVRTASGKNLTALHPHATVEIDYVPGYEDGAINHLLTVTTQVIDKINAARPAAASTPQEGTTTS